MLASHATAPADGPVGPTVDVGAHAEPAALEVHDLAHSYRSTPVLHQLTLTLPKGEYSCLLGDSGSGKTTLLRLIAGIERLKQGRISIGGTAVAAAARGLFLPPERRHLGMVFQDQALWPHMSLQAHVEFPLRARGQKVDRAALALLLGRMGLGGLEARKPGALSGGQRQRVGLARALAGNPRLLLLDEPLSAVDTAMRNELRGYLHALFREFRFSALHVTHDPEEAFQLGTRVGVLERGRLVQWDRPEALYRRPATINVARLTGPCGVVRAECIETDGQTAFIRWHGGVQQVPARPDVRPGPVWLILRPDAMVAEAHGLPARVTAARFNGDRWLAKVAMGDTDPLPVYLAEPPADHLTLRLREEAAWIIPPDTPTKKD